MCSVLCSKKCYYMVSRVFKMVHCLNLLLLLHRTVEGDAAAGQHGVVPDARAVAGHPVASTAAVER